MEPLNEVIQLKRQLTCQMFNELFNVGSQWPRVRPKNCLFISNLIGNVMELTVVYVEHYVTHSPAVKARKQQARGNKGTSFTTALLVQAQQSRSNSTLSGGIKRDPPRRERQQERATIRFYPKYSHNSQRGTILIVFSGV
jgi:hypothetical protein